MLIMMMMTVLYNYHNYDIMSVWHCWCSQMSSSLTEVWTISRSCWWTPSWKLKSRVAVRWWEQRHRRHHVMSRQTSPATSRRLYDPTCDASNQRTRSPTAVLGWSSLLYIADVWCWQKYKSFLGFLPVTQCLSPMLCCKTTHTSLMYHVVCLFTAKQCIMPTHRRMARLSWPGRLVTCRDG